MKNTLNKESIAKVCVLLIFAVIVCMVYFCININSNTAYAVSITEEESETENVDSLRYGYNVTAGKPLCDDGLVTSAPILKPLSEGLYKYISKYENNGKTVAGNYIAYDALSIAKQSGSNLSGSVVDANIKFVSMNIDAAFDRNSSFTTAYSERYETYYQSINRMYYLIQDTVDLRDYLSTSFITDLYNVKSENDALTLFNKYGTHLFTGFQYGGLMQVTNYIKTSSSNVNIEEVTSLNTKMNVAFAEYGLGASFSFAEQYATMEQKTFGTSNYKVTMYGGESVTAMTLDQLFTYNSSLVDGKGNYVYDRWVNSINDATRLAIIGTPSSARAIPLWDLLKDGGEYNTIKSCLVKAYSSLCGDKYAEFLEKYPTTKRTIGDEEASSGLCSVKGYSVTYNDNTIYYSDDNDTGEYNVLRDSKIFMNYTDTIPAGQKLWKITSGSQYATILDEVSGVFQVNCSVSNDKSFTIGLYSGDTLLYNREFTIVQDKYSGGDGEENPYLISSKGDFLEIIRDSACWGKSFKLTANIDLNGETISCIGNKNNYFSGVFDGNNCSISNFNLNSPNDSSLGLFAYSSGTIKNLCLSNLNISSVATSSSDSATNIAIEYAGGLVGYNNGTINNCRAESVTINIKYYPSNDFTMCTGGLVGYSEDKDGSCSTIEKCSLNAISVKALCNNGTGANPGSCSIINCVGGIVGKADKCAIKNSIVKKATLLHSQSIGNSAKAYSGGLVGYLNSNASLNYCVVGTIEEIYSRKSGREDLETISSLLVGKNLSSSIAGCYAKTFTGSCDETSSVETGVTGGVTVLEELTYKACGTLSSDVWMADSSDSYPVIKTQVFDSSTALTVDHDNAQTEYYYGEEFNIAGISVDGHYSSGGDSIKIDVFNYDASKFNNVAIGTYKIKITAMGYNTTYDVTVRKIRVVGLEIAALKDKYYVGDAPSVSDFQIKYILENGDKTNPTDTKVDYIDYPTQDIEITADVYVLGDNKITATCGVLSANIVVDAVEKEIVELKITQQPNKIVYYEGQELDTTGLEITATYSDETETILLQNEIEVIGKRISLGANTVMFACANYTTCNLTVTGEATSKNKYDIIFLDYDGAEISKITYEEGDTVIVPKNPTRSADNTYTYTFAGWDKTVTTVAGDTTYKATYTPTYIEYTVKFVNYDNSVIDTKNYHYGETVTVPENPSKDADETYTYAFKSWDNEVVDCVGNATYKATYDATYIDYTVIFKNYDGTELSNKKYHYGDEVIAPSNPTRDADMVGTFEFASWDSAVSNCSGDKVYKAVYNITYIDYTVIFKNYDGTELSNKKYHYGDEVTALTTTPTKPSDETYDYIFKGWDSAVVACDGNKTYTAVFDQEESATYKSAQLLTELNEIIDGVTTVDLNTYSTIVSIQERAKDLTKLDNVKLDAKLQPILTQYTEYVKSINSEYEVAEEVEKTYFIAVLEMINYMTVLAYAALKGKRWFL